MSGKAISELASVVRLREQGSKPPPPAPPPPHRRRAAAAAPPPVPARACWACLGLQCGGDGALSNFYQNGCINCLSACGNLLFCVPCCLACCKQRQLCCPQTLYPFYSLQMDAEYVTARWADNTCCCAVEERQQRMRLREVSEVSVCAPYNYLRLTDRINHQEMEWGFLAEPFKAQKAIDLAVTLKRDLCPMLQQQAIAVQPGQHVPSTSPAMQRMQRAEQLVKRGVLTDAEVAAHKVAILSSEPDPTLRLLDVASLRDRGLVTDEELGAIKKNVLASAGT